MLLPLIISACLFLQGSALQKAEAVEYLRHYGYIKPQVLQTDSQIPEKEFENGLILFQKFVGLKPTGKLDSETCTLMKKPRCGVKDKFEFEDGVQNSVRNRSKAWSREQLTYRVFRYAAHLPYVAVNAVFEQALLTWASVTNLHFQQIDGLADINIAFIDMNNFQPQVLRSDVYAHASFPPMGSVYFSQRWNWTIREPSGMNLFLVALHEFGHALGLQHSMSNESIMFPNLQVEGYNPNFMLNEEDVQNIQSLYGPRRGHPPALCPNSSFDAIFEDTAGVIYVLKGEYYWKLIADGIASGYPRLISHRWPELPSNIDAATATNRAQYFFKGNKYWTYDLSCNSVYQSYISVGWPGIPDNVDGATWIGHSVFYFFKGDSYWKYDHLQSPKVSTSYPKRTTDWGGVEGVLDDVLSVNSGYIYFFTNSSYYRYNRATALIDYGHPNQPNFPRSTGQWWFRCEEVEQTVTSAMPSASTVFNGTTAVSMAVTETTTPDSNVTDGEHTVTSAIPSASTVVNGTTATMDISHSTTTTNFPTNITTPDSNVTDGEQTVTSAIPSASTVVTGTTAIMEMSHSTTTTTNLPINITTPDSNATDGEQITTSTMPSTSIIAEPPPASGRELGNNDY